MPKTLPASLRDPGQFKPPTPAQLRATRLKAGHSRVQAAAILGKTRRGWEKWETESGNPDHRDIDFANWALYCILALHMDPALFRPRR